MLTVEVEEGVATRIESNYELAGIHPGDGRVCVKAYGLIQKTYNPNRIKQPMKRTNPKKGRGEDPGFAPISWEEALDIVGEKLRAIRAKGVRDETGVPRLAASFGGGGTPIRYMGTLPAFLAAWGPADLGFGSGQGVKCYHSEHLYGELWHRAFIVAPDTPYVRYVINCGNNVEAAGGVAGVKRHADARVRGQKRVQVEPHLSVTGAVSAEWVPIKPKTDAAFLFGLIHRIIIERDWQDVCDVPFLKDMSNSPYLVGPEGYYLRDPASEKPLIWDLKDNTAKPYDTENTDPALTGNFDVAGLEIGPDSQRWQHESVSVSPSFQVLMDHMVPYSPDWAAGECEVPAETIRRIADEYLENACIGETIDIEGEIMPFRPVAVTLGKTVNNGWGGYHACWARTMLAVLVGALETPGGIMGCRVQLVRPADSRTGSALPGPDGFMSYKFNETSANGWQRSPEIRNAFSTLVPLVSDSPWSPALGPAHLPWLFQKESPKNWPRQSLPEMWICYRTNPAISSWKAKDVADRIAEFPFTVAFAYTDDETNHMADILLPEATDLESLQLIRIGGTTYTENFWKQEGWAIRQPAIDPVHDNLDMTDIATELARQAGVLEGYNKAINLGAAGSKLKGEGYDYSLDPEIVHDRDDIWDAHCKSASHQLSGGEEVNGLDWFKENGFMLRDFSQLQWYLQPFLKRQKLRFELPYQERLSRHGRELSNRLKETGIDWWDSQLAEYEFLPTYHPFSDI
ncbi:MAG: molybdopterin-dependent oxidoreductase, partial [Rhodospirillales bacterium]|nr:molybdopterin-dependent oxidoreductase [Rhodospirillales bacterium]